MAEPDTRLPASTRSLPHDGAAEPEGRPPSGEGVSPTLLEAVARLEQAITAQVAREEQAMRCSSYPLASGHEEAHDLLLARIRGLLGIAASEAAAMDSRRAAVVEITEELRAHSRAYDSGLEAFLASHRRRSRGGAANGD